MEDKDQSNRGESLCSGGVGTWKEGYGGAVAWDRRIRGKISRREEVELSRPLRCAKRVELKTPGEGGGEKRGSFPGDRERSRKREKNVIPHRDCVSV